MPHYVTVLSAPLLALVGESISQSSSYSVSSHSGSLCAQPFAFPFAVLHKGLRAGSKDIFSYSLNLGMLPQGSFCSGARTFDVRRGASTL